LRFKRTRKFILFPHLRGAPRGTAHSKVCVRRADTKRRAAVMENAGASSTDQLRVSRIRLANLYGFAAVQARLASHIVKARLFDLWMIVTIFQLASGLRASLACVMYKGSSLIARTDVFVCLHTRASVRMKTILR